MESRKCLPMRREAVISYFFAGVLLFLPVNSAETFFQQWSEGNVSAPIKAVAYGKGIYVAVGSRNYHEPPQNIFTSSDGETWVGQSENSRYSLKSVAFGDTAFIAAGYGVCGR